MILLSGRLVRVGVETAERETYLKVNLRDWNRIDRWISSTERPVQSTKGEGRRGGQFFLD